MTSKELRELFEAQNQRPVTYYKGYTDIMGSLSGGVYLSQLLFWHRDANSNKRERFVKTDAQIISHTGLTTNQIRAAKRKAKDLGFVKVAKKGVPPKTVYTLDEDMIIAALLKHVKITSLENPKSQTRENHQFERVKITSSIIKETKQEILTPSCILPQNPEEEETPQNTPSDLSESSGSNSSVSANTKTNATKKTRRTAHPAFPLPDTWEITEELREWARKKCPLVNIRNENEMFVNHFRPEPGEKIVKRPGWTRTWKGWMLRVQGRNEERGHTISEVAVKSSASCSHKGALPTADGEHYRCDLCRTKITDAEFKRARGIAG